MRKRVVLVYNPHSSHYKKIEKRVLKPAKDLTNFSVYEFEVEKIAIEENIKALASILKDGDLVVAIGGDGTATMALNAILSSNRKMMCFGVLGFGNFNDVAASIGNNDFEELINKYGADEVHEVWPLECYLDGKLWRYGMCYFTIGMMAESCSTFEAPRIRRRLKSGGRRIWYSAWKLFGWWRKNREREFLPNEFILNQKKVKNRSDILILNGRRMAHFIKGGPYFAKPDEIKWFSGDMRSLWGIFSFMLRSMILGMPGRYSERISVEFNEKSDVAIQGEGEMIETNIRTIEIVKSRKSVMVTGWGIGER